MANYNKLKHGQIGIFVVLAIIIIFVLVFIISTSTTSKLDNIDNSNINIKNSDGDLFPLKTSIDTCLETQLKTAILIAGLRGGLIYSDGERYVSSNGVNNYDPNILTNFQLNPNYLSQNLIHSQYDALMPQYNKTFEISVDGVIKTIYSHSIEEDFKRFILSNLHSCLNFEELKNEYKITQNIFFGKLIRFDAPTQTLEATPFDAKLGDTISFTLDGVIYYGIVKQTTPGENVIINFLGNPLTSQTRFEDILIINLNNSVEIEIFFENNNVATKLTYPVILEQNNKKVYFKETKISVQNRMKKLLELGNYLLNEKIYNRTLDYSNQTDLQKVLNLNPFYGDLDTSELDFEISVANDELDYKLKTISIIDNRFKLFSNPFVMNFGYENSAPKLFLKSGNYEDLTLLNPFIGYFTTQINKPSTINLREEFSLSDNQFLDNYASYFIEQSITNTQYEFILSSEGILEFEAYENGVYNFDIEITDGEAINIYQFTIDAGLDTGFDAIDLSNYKLLFLSNYNIGDTNLEFTEELGVFSGTLEETSQLINVKLDTKEAIREDYYGISYYNNLIVSGSFSNDAYSDFKIENLGQSFAAKIPDTVANLFTSSNNFMYYFLLNKNKPKTEAFIRGQLPQLDSVTIKEFPYSNGKHYIIELEQIYDTSGSKVKTKFPYYNTAPAFDIPFTSTIPSYNNSNKSRTIGWRSLGVGPSALDYDGDPLKWISVTQPTPSGFSVGGSSVSFYIMPSTSIGYHSINILQTDGELNSSIRTITFDIFE